MTLALLLSTVADCILVGLVPIVFFCFQYVLLTVTFIANHSSFSVFWNDCFSVNTQIYLTHICDIFQPLSRISRDNHLISACLMIRWCRVWRYGISRSSRKSSQLRPYLLERDRRTLEHSQLSSDESSEVSASLRWVIRSLGSSAGFYGDWRLRDVRGLPCLHTTYNISLRVYIPLTKYMLDWVKR